VEKLEERQQLAAGVLTPAIMEAPLSGSGLTPAGGTSSVDGYAIWKPDQIRTKYGFNQLFHNTGLDGTGQTIALIEAYDNPYLKPNLDVFDGAFAIAAPPLFQKAPHAGVPVVDFTKAKQRSWALEADMDLQWAHAIAPGASIIEYEAASDSETDLMAAVGRAANDPAHPEVSVISMSFGEQEGIQSDAYFNQPANHRPITFIASSGDQDFWTSGMSLNWPAVAPNVLGVGGSFLEANGFEIPWYQNSPTINRYGDKDPSNIVPGGTNGGYSNATPEPSYQQSVQNTGKRSVPDVSFNADWNYSPIMVYEQAKGGWLYMGGTSEGAPQWAGLIALANQGRASLNRATLGNAVADIYAVASTDFNTAANGGTYFTGYNTYLGRGTPRADLLVPDLIYKVEAPWWVTNPPYSAGAVAYSANSTTMTAMGMTSPFREIVPAAFSRVGAMEVAPGPATSPEVVEQEKIGLAPASDSDSATLASPPDKQAVQSLRPSLSNMRAAPKVLRLVDWYYERTDARGFDEPVSGGLDSAT
jgi:subtilase family serine protease